jgi:hypothetical protein
MWSMQRRLNDCYRQQRFPEPGYASDVTVALGVYLGVNAKGDKSPCPPSSAEPGAQAMTIKTSTAGRPGGGCHGPAGRLRRRRLVGRRHEPGAAGR